MASWSYVGGMVLCRERWSRGIGLVEPCLPSTAKAPPSGSRWIHEIKHYGFRLMARRDAFGVRPVSLTRAQARSQESG
jgi:hypothetical protein